ncbi:MAG: LamG domain-containing protein [Planctomycetes bacterium]|nr:LamG domain-containing protein [Planctomycetota bacterium]
MCRKLIYLVSLVLVLSMALTSTTKAELIGWWRFNEGSGDTANDSSGNDHHGTLIGTPEWVVGPDGFGSALAFNPDVCVGVDCGIFDPTNGTGQFTVALWAYWDGTGTFMHFLTKSAGWGADTMMFQIELWGAITNPAEIDRLGLSYQGNISSYNSSSGSTPFSIMPKNEWVHLAFTFDGSYATVYVNGVDKVGPKDFSIGPDVDATVYIGVSHPDEGRTFHGSFDEVRIYDKALTAEEIQIVMVGGEGFPNAFAPEPANGSLYPDTWVNLSWRPGDFAHSHDVYFGENFNDVNDGTEGTFLGNQNLTFIIVGFPGFAYPDGLVPGTTYYWRVDEVNETEPNSPWKGNVWSFSVPPKTAYFPNPADGADSVDVNVELSWTAGFGAKLHTVYFGNNFDQVNNATGGQSQGSEIYTPGTLELSKTYYWRVDEFDIAETHKGDIWSFTTEGAVGSPWPANGAVDITQTPVLTWSHGVYADSHQVYFGTDKEAVKNADTSSPQYKGSGNLGSESYDPGQLEWNTTYYWRVDEANNVNTDSPWTGPLWSFTTANFLIIDDMESYNDLDPADPLSNRIFNAWIDGLGDQMNGSIVGYDFAPFAEQTIVHSGNQSMPMSYDNSAAAKSEVTLTLTSNRDWTIKGVSRLSIWYQGDAINAAETMYVTLNSIASVDNDNPDAALASGWTEWNIDLQAFADQGVDLANVNSITLGLGNRANPVAGGAGMMYFDDIRLYPPAP